MNHSSMHAWYEKLVVVLIWAVLAWVVWDFIHWVDPPYRFDPAFHPPRVSPRGLNPGDGR